MTITARATMNVSGWPAAVEILVAQRLKNFRIGGHNIHAMKWCRSDDQPATLTSIATEAEAMTTVAAQPSSRSGRAAVKRLITLRLETRTIIAIISGTA